MKRRWFQFRLRTLFVLLTLSAVVTGVVQHVWYVRERLQFHEAKLAVCYERLEMKVNINAYLFLQKLNRSAPGPDSGPAESVRIQQAIGDGYLLYAPDVTREIKFNDQKLKNLVEEHEREVARLKKIQFYHQQQAESYRRAMWRPWSPVVEDRSQELADEPAEAAPVPTPTVVIPSPAPASPGVEDSVPNLPAPSKIKLPWQSIERPLPPNFDQ